VHKKTTNGFKLFFTGAAIAVVALAGGCGGPAADGTSVKFNPEENKKQQDAMRENMMKNMKGGPGSGAPGKK
jgi:hypothetical protein